MNYENMTDFEINRAVAKVKKLPTKKYLEECFNYDPESGLLTWKARPRSHFSSERSMKISNTRFSGKLAGCENVDGRKGGSKKYMRVMIDGKRYRSHRIIRKMVKGEEPETIDHINGDGKDNRISNLRNVTLAENARNCTKSRNNTSGYNGVCRQSNCKKWRASITINYKKINLGYFYKKEDAYKAVEKAKLEFGFHDSHGHKK